MAEPSNILRGEPARRRNPEVEERATPWVAVERELGTLALSQIEGAGSTALSRAIAWHNVLVRLGMCVPLVVVHDLGCLISGIGRPTQVARGPGDARLADAWRRLLVELADSEAVRATASWKHRDAMVGVVVARVASCIGSQLPERVRQLRPTLMMGEPSWFARVDPRAAYVRYDQDAAQTWLLTMTQHRLLPLLEIEQVDLDALRLLGLFRTSNDLGGFDLADLYSVLLNAGLSDVVDFSLELLPSLLETRREAGQQSFGIDGYAAIERVGHLDNLMLSQLAYDDEVFLQKLVDNELFYYTHERQYDVETRTHQILIDGSASMRGAREVFARGLALALAKRLSLLGEDVVLRFFDSRLYEGVRVTGTGAELPYVLSFRAEKGRNYAAVVRQLDAELSRKRRKRGHSLIYLLTHGEAAFPRDTMLALAHKAPIYGVFMLPRGRLDLGFVDALHRVHVIDADAISHGRRASKARQIIGQVEDDLERSGAERGGGVR